jgi:hypothetical protein
MMTSKNHVDAVSRMVILKGGHGNLGLDGFLHEVVNGFKTMLLLSRDWHCARGLSRTRHDLCLPAYTTDSVMQI